MHVHVRRWFTAGLVGAVSATLALTATSQAAPPTTAAASATPAVGAAEPLGSDAVAVARRFVGAHAAEYGLGKADVEQLAVSSVVPSDSNGLTHVYLQQRVSSVEVSTAMLNVAVTSTGTVLRVASSAVAGATKRANGATPKISDVQAADEAATALGLRAPESFASGDRARGSDRERKLGDGGVSSDPVTARLVYQETKQGDLRLAWELVINQLDGQHWWQIRMDAATGKELSRTDWVDEDSHRVFPFPVEAPSFGARALVANPATVASPFGWNDTNGVAGAESTLTIGNNVSAYTDLNDDDVPDAGSSPNGGAGLAFDFALDLAQPPSAYRPAAVSNLYYANNRIHDVLYRYGFTEAAGNFQVNNYGNGALGSDAVNAEAQDGGGTNNANFGTPPDGARPRMQMYVWDISTPDRDGDLDNGIIVHEYGHGVSNRLTGGPNNTSCLNNQEQGGEGWSDFLAYMMTMPTGTEPAAGRGIGTYSLNQPTNGPGIRTQKYSRNMGINNHTYDDIKTMAIPHGVGEVWATMLWDLTYDLIDEYGFNADLVTGNAGNNKALQLVMDGMKLQPCSPGFVDARDAILAADVAAYGGANECLIWSSFARRGLGSSAVQGSSANTSDGTEAFDLPPACSGVEVTTTGDPSPVRAGQELTYKLRMKNTSGSPVTGVNVSSALGDHVSYVGRSASCGGTYNAGARKVTFGIGNMATNAVRNCQFRVKVAPSPFTTTRFTDDFEPDLSGWTATHDAGTVDWTLTTTDPHSPTHAAFSSAPGATSDQRLTMAAPVSVGANESLSFWHQRGFEESFDGGVVEVSTDGGATWADIGAAAFTENGYDATISGGFGNPLGGREAFSGTSSYTRSVASLAAYAGQAVLVRFRTGTDSSVSGTGWTVDDVQIGREVVTTNRLTVAVTGFPSYLREVATRIVAPPPATKPGRPVVKKSTPLRRKKAKIAFVLANNGGSPVTKFQVKCKSSNRGKTRQAKRNRSPITVKRLSPGKKYTCKVRATNAVGTSQWSKPGKKFRAKR